MPSLALRVSMALMVPLVHHRSPPEAKIALFRSLFRGREDVYPRRFESRKTGKSGYQPACANEWVRGVCEKPKVKCAECPQRRFSAGHRRGGSLAPFGPRRRRPRFRHGRLSHAPGRKLLLSGGRFRQDPLAGRRRGRAGNVPPPGPARRPGAIAIRQRRARVAVLRRGHPRRLGPQARFAHPHRDHGTPAGHRPGFLRPVLPQPGHAAPGRISAI